jgi:hypothetical protein
LGISLDRTNSLKSEMSRWWILEIVVRPSIRRLFVFYYTSTVQYSTVRILRRYLVSSATSDQSVHIFIYYIVESEILKNTQWHIFHIFTSEDIDHVTFSIYTICCFGLYNKQNITRWLEDMTFIFSC